MLLKLTNGDIRVSQCYDTTMTAICLKLPFFLKAVGTFQWSEKGVLYRVTLCVRVG